MYNRKLYSRVVRFQRTAVENTFNILTTIQGHSDKIMKKSLEQMPWIPPGSKSTCIGLSDSCIHGSNNLRKVIVQSFDGVERLLAGTDTAQKKNQSGQVASPSRPASTAGPKKAVKRKARSAQKIAPKTGASTPVDTDSKSKIQSAAGKPGETAPVTAQTKPASLSPPSSPPVPATTSSPSPAMPKPAEPSEKQTKSDSAQAGKPTR